MGTFLFLFDACHVSFFVFSLNYLTILISVSFSVLSIATNADDKTLLFEIVFCIVWIGGAVIAVNGQLLGGTISFF